MELILRSVHDDVPERICMQTSRRTCIDNEKRSVISEQDIYIPRQLESLFNSQFLNTAPTSAYNCHGLTLASKRTGIYDTSVIERILSDEYLEVKSSDVIVGDIVIYYESTSNDITHSAIVVEVPGILPKIPRVLSKIKYYKEIVHYVNNSAYGSNYRFYRINHVAATYIR